MSEPRKVGLELDGTAFRLVREFDAPRDLVWRAWTEPGMLAAWFGPHGFSCPTCNVELRPGGPYRIVMRGPDGVDYPIIGQVLEVRPPERLVMSVLLDEHPAAFHAALAQERGAGGLARPLTWDITFEDLGGRTRVTVVNRFGDATERDIHVKVGAYDGWSQSFEKLDRVLDERSTA